MNTLSLFIYLANVIDNMSGYLTFIAFIFFVITGFVTLGTFIYTVQEEMPTRKWLITLGFTWVLTIGLGLLVAFIPSERTIYMIAASELGEQVVTNPEAQEVMTALKERIMLELKGTPSE